MPDSLCDIIDAQINWDDTGDGSEYDGNGDGYPDHQEFWDRFRDRDGDGLPGAIDPLPNGTVHTNPHGGDAVPTGGFLVNFGAPMPAHANAIESLLAEAVRFAEAGLTGSASAPDGGPLPVPQLDIGDVMPSAAQWDVDGDGLVTVGEAFHLLGARLFGEDAQGRAGFGAAVRASLDAYAGPDGHVGMSMEDFEKLFGPDGSASNLLRVQAALMFVMSPVIASSDGQEALIFSSSREVAFQRFNFYASLLHDSEDLLGRAMRRVETLAKSIIDAANAATGHVLFNGDPPEWVYRKSAVELVSSSSLAFITLIDGTPSIRLEISGVDPNTGDDVTFRKAIDPGAFRGLSPDLANLAGDPVDTWTGEFVHSVTDLTVPGRGLDLVLSRHYRSRALRRGVIGRNWFFDMLDTYLEMPTSGDVSWMIPRLAWGDGLVSHFVVKEVDGVVIYEGIAGEFGKIKMVTNGHDLEPGCPTPAEGYVLRKPNGMLYYFCPPAAVQGADDFRVAWLRKISDPSGNAIVLQRDDRGRVEKIIDTLAREYVLQYDDEHDLLTSIHCPDGRIIEYTYDLAPYHIDDPAQPNSPMSILARKYDLLRVDYPETLRLENGTTQTFRPFERYEYHEHPDGYGTNPSPELNHNLARVFKSSTSPKVDLTYGVDVDSFEYDRVTSYVVEGKTTTFKYEQTDPSVLDSYAQGVALKTTMRHPDGDLQTFVHDQMGRLVREETAVARDVDGDFLPDAGGEPEAGETAYVTLFDYSDDHDSRMTMKRVTTDIDFASGAWAETEYVWNTSSTDRFQQSQVTQRIERPLSTDRGEAAELIVSHTYDPLTNRVRETVDPIGRVTTHDFGHQELSWHEVKQKFGVKGWSIDGATGVWGLGDVNQDGRVGSGDEFPLVGIIRTRGTDVEVQGPLGPGNASTMRPTTLHQYNEFGQPVKECDTRGLWVDTTYCAGYPETMTFDPGGADLVTSYIYEADNGFLRAETNAAGESTSYLRDAFGRVLEDRRSPRPNSDEHLELVRRHFYDAGGRLVGAENAVDAVSGTAAYSAGHVPAISTLTTYDNESRSRFVRVEARFGDDVSVAVSENRYDGRGNLVEVVSSAGATILTRYDTRRLPTEIERRDENGQTVSISHNRYDRFGRLVSSISAVDRDDDGVSDTTTYEYDGYGRLRVTVSPEGRRAEADYDDVGRTTEVRSVGTDGLIHARATTTYDTADRVVRQDVDDFVVDAAGAVVPNGTGLRTTVFGYGIGTSELLWTIVDPTGAALRSRSEYDLFGRVTANYRGTTVEIGERLHYDVVGRLIAREVVRDSVPVGGNPKWMFVHDGYGRRIMAIDPLGNATMKTLRPDGWVAAVEAANGRRVEYEYDSQGRIRERRDVGTDGASRSVSYEYDARGNATAFVDAEGRRTTSVYDAFDRLLSKRYVDGKGQDYFYDAVDQVVRLEHVGVTQPTATDWKYRPDGMTDCIVATGADAAVTKTYVYDAAARPVVFTDAVAGRRPVQVTRRYSSTGDVVEESTVYGAQGGFSFQAIRDGAGRANAVDYPSGEQATFGYDDVGRLNEAWRYDTNGAPTQLGKTTSYFGTAGSEAVDLLNGARVHQTVDALGRVDSRCLRTSSSTIMVGDGYVFDSVGNVTERTYLADGRVDRFVIDGFDRLKTWKLKCQPNGSPLHQTTWTHDDADNWSQVASCSLGVESMTTNTLNQLTAFREWVGIDYTALGQEACRCKGPGDTIAWEWDALGRPVRATISQPVVRQVEYEYDAFDRVVSRIVDGQDETRNGYFGGLRLLREHVGGVTRTFFPGPHGLWYHDGGGAGRYLYFNVLGHVEAVHDGAVVQEYFDYTPYGVPVDGATGAKLNQSTTGNDLFFEGALYDFDLETVRLGARTYDPAMGRFLSRDPLGEAASANLYNYALQNPLRWHDATGQSPEERHNAAAVFAEGQRIAGVQAKFSEIRAAAEAGDVAGFASATGISVRAVRSAIRNARLAGTAESGAGDGNFIYEANGEGTALVVSDTAPQALIELGITPLTEYEDLSPQQRHAVLNLALLASSEFLRRARGGDGDPQVILNGRTWIRDQLAPLETARSIERNLGGWVPGASTYAEALVQFSNSQAGGQFSYRAVARSGAIEVQQAGAAVVGAYFLAKGAYKTFRALKNALGGPGKGNQWHHIVEQSQRHFDRRAIQNRRNIVALSESDHRSVSGYYSSKRGFTNGLTIRSWLRENLSYDEQRAFGLRVLRQLGIKIKRTGW